MIELRPLEKTDLPKLLIWRNDPAVTEHLGRIEMSRTQLDAWFETLGRSNGNLAYAVEYDGRFVGYGVLESIDDTNRKCEIGVILGEKSSWGQRIGPRMAGELVTIAFDELKMHRILAVASERNVASIKCFQKVGFTEEGRLRHANRRDGEYFDLVLLSLLEDERNR